MLSQPLRLGTRNSALARCQAQWVADRLRDVGATVELTPIATQGDRLPGPLLALGGVGIFTKAIQERLLEGSIDLAVHSMKDLPTQAVSGLRVAAVPKREPICDVLICREANDLRQLPASARVGTGSLRRKAQLLYLRSDLVVMDIRGNVDTRLSQLSQGAYDAIVLAEAGLRRLGWENRVTQVLSCEAMLPAVGQGALAIECREDAAELIELLQELEHAPTRAAVTAERSMLASLRAGCLAPVGAWARTGEGETLMLDAAVLSADGQQRLTASVSGLLTEADAIGQRAADTLLQQGAAQLIASARL